MKFIKIIPAIAFCFFAPACSSQPLHYDMKELEHDKIYSVWCTIHENLIDGTERDVLFVDYDFVASLPPALKTIVARYTMFVPDYIWTEVGEEPMAQALAGFKTLKQAQETLLKDWDGEQVVLLSGYPAALQVRQTDESVIFEYWPMWSRDARTDEFRINKDGKITYAARPEPIEYEPYSREKILDDYSFYRIRLNGEPVEYFEQIFLDADNVKSMGVNKLDRIVYITQKNPCPDYFVRDDLSKYLDRLTAFRVTSLDEISLISIDDKTTKDYFREFSSCDRIEETAIKAINSGIREEYDLKFVVIELK